MLRAANQRHNFIFEANVRCSLLRRETSGAGEFRLPWHSERYTVERL
jgi:hypothetical protein